MLKKIHFFQDVFDSFSLLFPLFMPKSKSFLSLFTQLLFFKERKELLALASLQKSDHERFAPVAHDKRATGVIRSFSRAKHSFAQKNERFAQKNQ